jgi:hypothetical protein
MYAWLDNLKRSHFEPEPHIIGLFPHAMKTCKSRFKVGPWADSKHHQGFHSFELPIQTQATQH